MQEISETHSLLEKLDNSVIRVEQFISKRMKQLGEVQIKIILLKKVEELKHKINKLINSPELTSNERVQGFNEFIPRMRSILNKLPPYNELGLVRIKFNSLHNLLIIAYAVQQLSDDSTVKLHSQATLISNMLLGVPRIEYTPEKLTNPTKIKLEERKTYFNAIQITSGLYLTALNQLYVIQKDHAIKWIDEVCHHLEIFLQFIEKVDLKHLWEIEKDDYETFYFKLWASVLPSSQFFSFLITYALLGDDWPKEIEYKKLLPSPNIDGFIKLNERVQRGVKKIIDDLLRYYKDGIIHKNANPENFNRFQLIKILHRSIQLPNLLIDAYSQNISSESNPESVSKALNAIDKLLGDYIEVTGGVSEVMESTYGPTVLLLTQAQLLVSVLLAEGTGDFDDYLTSLDKVSFVFETQEPSKIPELYFLKEMTHLYLGLELSEDININEVINSLKNLLPAFQNRPQFALSAEILILILTQLITNPEPTTCKTQLQRIRDTYIMDSGLIHLKNDFDEFTTYLNNVFKTKKNQPSPFMRREINILDPFTWLIPDFSKLVDSEYDVVYLPFNREKDRLFELQ